ncbi:MAG: D-alanyl-D-alanine carboxypeptidase [Clostridiales Family XIII bacterium]|jgi:D-alanyl-D-alanine carboxypeptidase (penicillin-binding protein 5/6)|nr:D-alanyl-D-alanine carboxypeptidase [Clostridiales Family XIII bacterium]
MTPPSARGARSSAPQPAGPGGAGSPAAARSAFAGTEPAAAKPAAGRIVAAGTEPAAARPAVTDWNAFLASHAEAVQKAESRKRRLLASVVIFLALVLAFDPLYEYACEKYLPERLSVLLGRSADRFKEIPHKLRLFFSSADEDGFEVDLAEYYPPLASAYDANPNFSVMSLKSSAAILANADTGSVLLKKRADIQVYPASLTKIMTVLLAIEHRGELPDRIVLDPALLQPLYDANSTMAGFLPNEEVETTDLIHGALLLSGGECAVALAQAIAGSEAEFAALMNARARELGMLDTHFANATGLHDPEHYSTVRDIAKLLLHALQNDVFAEVFTTEEHETAPTNLNEDGMRLTNGVFARAGALTFAGGRILGGKTGWTSQAGQCLASLAEKNGNRYIFVSTGNNVVADGTAYNFEDARNAYENGILPVR